MPRIRISELRNSSILRIYAERHVIQADPDYQRMGGVWNLEKRQLLMDTVINDFDMPKLYFHEFTHPRELADGSKVNYAIVDGRQRLETIWSFIDGDFTLADDFEFYEDPSVNAAGLTYAELGKRYPHLKTMVDSYTLPITAVLTEDIDLIEEMFLRLNEAVPLNAAEKRNAIGGPMARTIREVANHVFFENNIPFSNLRYQHREVAAKFLLLTWTDAVGDTKKAYLDNMVRRFKDRDDSDGAGELEKRVGEVLNHASQIFVREDVLLKTQAMTVIYFLALKRALDDECIEVVTRSAFVAFEKMREENRSIAEDDIADASYELLEFDRMHSQGSNDKSSIEFRLDILYRYIQSSI